MILKKKLRFICHLKKKYFKKKLIFISLIIIIFLLKYFTDKKNDFDELITDLRNKNLKSVQLITGR
jgi:hypothetical protein